LNERPEASPPVRSTIRRAAITNIFGCFADGIRQKVEDAMTKRNIKPIKALLFTAILCLSAAAQPQTITGKVVAIADGDTLTVLDASNRQHKIRLDGIDAPESSQDFGSRAKQSLSDLIFGKTVSVISSKKDRYGRTLGKVTIDGRDINLEQI
jgi:endonuclease YncB( thermonuclease family)